MTNMLSTNAIILKNEASPEQRLEAIFLPERGMNLISFKKGGVEIIDQSTWSLFEDRFSGLGALIGPHFHRRNPATLPKIADESLFPHIARVKARGTADPFSHGIARYAPWKTSATSSSIRASLSGKDEWNGVPLSALEGQNFKMNFNASLTSSALEIELDVVSDADSVVGIHYYLRLPKNAGKVISTVQPNYIGPQGRQALPSTWNIDSQHVLTFDLSLEADFTFYPFPNPREGTIRLETEEYQLEMSYTCPSQENCWQLYHPRDASFVCIEPLSAQDPRHPNLTVSSIRIALRII